MDLSVIMPGQTHDAVTCPELLSEAEIRSKTLIADKGYNTDAIQDEACFHGTNPIIPSKSNRTVQRSVDRRLYALRNRIEMV